jgi:hypothetical protein
MLARFTIRKTDFVASRLAAWVSTAINHNAKMKNSDGLNSYAAHRRPGNLRCLAKTCLITLCVIGCLGLSALAVNRGSWIVRTSIAERKDPAPARAAQTPTPLQLEYITLLPSGCEPAIITRPQGQFVLIVDNYSGYQQPLSLRLDRVAGNRLREAALPAKKRKWRELVDLPPGTYRLTEANNPQWDCQITITAR